MAIKKAIVWNHITLPDAYLKVISHADSQSVSINIGVYTNKESRDAGDQPIYTINENVPFEIHQQLFSEDALKAEGVTARSQSYIYLKSLPDFADCEDI